MGSPHGWMFWTKQAYHVWGPLPFNPLDQLAESKVTQKDIYLFLGTTYEFHKRRASNPFIIIGVFYPPKTPQLPLFQNP